MNLQPIFTNFIAIDFLSFESIPNLENFCYDKIKIEESDPGQSDLSLFELESFLRPLTLQIQQKILELKNYFEFKEDVDLKIVRAWLNLNQNHNITSPHLHKNSLISGVLYIKAQDSGELVLLNPIVPHQYVIDPDKVKKFNSFNSAVFRVKPETGKLIIFPSWLMHYVESNPSNHDRISLAFNIVTVN
jgi:uncharacterized protein (TIGR02466 family)